MRPHAGWRGRLMQTPPKKFAPARASGSMASPMRSSSAGSRGREPSTPGRRSRGPSRHPAGAVTEAQARDALYSVLGAEFLDPAHPAHAYFQGGTPAACTAREAPRRLRRRRRGHRGAGAGGDGRAAAAVVALARDVRLPTSGAVAADANLSHRPWGLTVETFERRRPRRITPVSTPPLTG